MARFSPRRLHFGNRPDQDDDGTGLPLPLRVKLAARRAAGIREAREILDVLPAPGEATHALVSCRLDLADVLDALLEKKGRCDRMAVATLGYSARNHRAMLRWLDSGQVTSLTLLASRFFRAHCGERWQETLAEFRKRGQRAACAASHAKVCALSFADGTSYAVEGSSNLAGSGSVKEQFALINDGGLCEWHRRWIEEEVARHEGDAP
jgi:hypothetical protein